MIPTPHITAKAGDFAKTVLMPGDPLRSRFVAEHFLENAVLVNDVRGVQGYTGTYKGKRISVMASGMGMPSMGIYSYELFNFYGTENIIRIGSAGAVNPTFKIGDVVIGKCAYTMSTYGSIAGSSEDCTSASPKLLKAAANAVKTLGKYAVVGNIFSTDVFYDDGTLMPLYKKLGIDAVEMEAAALYINAALAGKHALAVCTVSDSLVTGESSSAMVRQFAFLDMMELALEIAISV
ncbi:MAG: purine-nucleoside phosphorylase [Clostridiaceae bacterium]|jgi:purine-nucleoside phosphorylase|nr:purine-nucleoside phosphorylase [Clostridiaceae bacterium]